MYNTMEQTTSTEGVQVAGFFDDAKEKLQEWIGCDEKGTVDTTPAISDDPGAHPAEVASLTQSIELVSAESQQTPSIQIEVNDLDVNIEYPDINFEAQTC